VAIAIAQRPDAFTGSRENPAISYNTAPTTTVVNDLNDRLEKGTLKFNYSNDNGYLKPVLAALNVPVESQVLVYTGTSLQAPKINMQNPRAIFFTDTVSVGWVRNGVVLEIAAQDPRQGTIYYTLDQATQGAPHFSRRLDCLSCHLSWDTLAVPGPLVLSTFPRKGDKDYANGFAVDHYSSIGERWGGWYVTGKRVPMKHMGNFPLILPKPLDYPPPARTSLDGLFDLDGYPTHHSDVVALLILEHQAHATNLITRLAWEARVGHTDKLPEAINNLVDYLLFVDEANFAEGRIEGSSGFTEKFESLGPKDAQGRSLRDLDLQSRIMKYPLSYMIYTPAFDALPADIKSTIARKIKSVLNGEDSAKKWAYLTAPTRQAILEILKETKPDF
jgi:hypothetical protein